MPITISRDTAYHARSGLFVAICKAVDANKGSRLLIEHLAAYDTLGAALGIGGPSPRDFSDIRTARALAAAYLANQSPDEIQAAFEDHLDERNEREQ